MRFLPHRRLRDVLERRYGFASGTPETLESIGKSYKITRERVRQIEEDALRRVRDARIDEEMRPLFSAIMRHIDEHGGVAEEQKLFRSIADPRAHAHVAFLLDLAPELKRAKENELFYPRWYAKSEARNIAEETVQKTSASLAEVKKPVPGNRLFEFLVAHARSLLGKTPSPEAVDSYLSISRRIRQNPYGEFGLAEWPAIIPSGVRDKAYAALAYHGEPLHFRKIATQIDKAGWDGRSAHPQTVHNELIKDKRFVLVGRGLYALEDWGYEAGTVADVIASVLAKSGSFLQKPELIKRVLEKRKVKGTTILLNLQNRKRFKKTKEGYGLA